MRKHYLTVIYFRYIVNIGIDFFGFCLTTVRFGELSSENLDKK